MTGSKEKPLIILFDGVCGFCHGWVQFLIKRDHADRLRFAPLQGPYAEKTLQRHQRRAIDLNTVYLIENAGEAQELLWERADAALRALSALGGGYRACALFQFVPRWLRNAVYHLVARSRYHLFGKLSACPIPSAAQRAKFID